MEQSQKTLSSILLKLLNPQATIPLGFSMPPSNIGQPANDNTIQVSSMSTPPHLRNMSNNSTENFVVPPSQVVIPSRPLNASTVSSNQECQVITPICPVSIFTPTVNSLPADSDSPELPRPSSSDTSLSNSEITKIYRHSCSQQNFSSRLVRRLFDEHARKTSNVAGRLGKSQLDTVIMSYVKSLTFQFFPLNLHEKQDRAWAACIGAIDEANRRLNNKPRKKMCLHWNNQEVFYEQ